MNDNVREQRPGLDAARTALAVFDAWLYQRPERIDELRTLVTQEELVHGFVCVTGILARLLWGPDTYPDEIRHMMLVWAGLERAPAEW